MRITILLFIIIVNTNSLFSQVYDKSESKKTKYLKDSIAKLDIPSNLDECFIKLDKILNDSTISSFKQLTEDVFLVQTHMTLGRYLRNNWGLWAGSKLSRYFNNLEIFHPDDMSSIILTSYHRFLCGKKILLEDQINHYKNYWKDVRNNDIRESRAELNKYKIGSIVSYNYRNGYSSNIQDSLDTYNICVANGIVIKMDTINFLIKVKVLNSCDKKGIVSYDSAYHSSSPNNSLKKTDKRVIKYLKKGKALWFYCKDWNVTN